MQLPYKTYRKYLKSRFGTSVFKVALNGGFSCPNKVGGGACAFCDNPTFSPAAHRETNDCVRQLRDAIGRNKQRYDAFIAYLQPNTNTYGSRAELEAIYEP